MPNSTAQTATESNGGPRLAHVNPSPRLPGSEAQPGPTLDRFAKRLRRVELGSHRLKMAALALCPYGQCWSDVLTEIQINIKRATLAAEWECRLATVDDVLRDLARVGILGRKRSRGHIRLTLFDRIQNPESDRIPITLETSESDRIPITLETESDRNPITLIVRTTQQQQQDGGLFDEELPAGPKPEPLPTPKQMRGISSMARELREDAPAVETRAQADETFRQLKRRVSTRRNKSSRDAYAARQDYRDYAGRLRELRRQDAGGDA